MRLRSTRVFFTVLAAILTAQAAQAQSKQAYVCLEQGSTGFTEDRGAFRQTVFKPQNFSMVLDGTSLELRGTDGEEVYNCTAPYQSRKHVLQCSEKFYFLTFDTQQMKFIKSRMFGNLGLGKMMDDVSVSYGNCQKF